MRNIPTALPKGEILIYTDPSGQENLEVKLEGETIWLTQAQIAKLFGKDVRTISEHTINIFDENELNPGSTIRNFRIVRNEGGRSVSREVIHYNLDVIISVGYRVNSKRGTQFRIWATNVLRKHLVDGYTLNQKRLESQIEKYHDLQQSIKLLEGVIASRELNSDEATGLLQVITTYNKSLSLLGQYDYGQLPEHSGQVEVKYRLDYHTSHKVITELKAQLRTSDLFGVEKDDSFAAIFGAIYQSFAGHEQYKTVEEKAANLLYLTIKNHPFIDGNKRIGSFLFLWFLERNGMLLRANGQKVIAENTIVALALLVAESAPENKDILTKLITNLINAV